jgi:hypothetical protein
MDTLPGLRGGEGYEPRARLQDFCDDRRKSAHPRCGPGIVSYEQEWEFFCECGRDDCQERLKLTLDAYVALYDSGRAVLAEGHQLSQVERARRLRDDAEALRRQAEHQVRRVKKIRPGT